MVRFIALWYLLLFFSFIITENILESVSTKLAQDALSAMFAILAVRISRAVLFALAHWAEFAIVAKFATIFQMEDVAFDLTGHTLDVSLIYICERGNAVRGNHYTSRLTYLVAISIRIVIMMLLC